MIVALLVLLGIYVFSVALLPLSAWFAWWFAPPHEPEPETRVLLRQAVVHPWWGPAMAASLLHALCAARWGRDE